MTERLLSLRRCLHAVAMLWALSAHAASAADGCSIYSPYGGNNGKTWFNEYYFGPATNHFLEIFSKNPAVTQSNPSIWNKWHIGVYSSKGAEYYSLAGSTTACTVSGGRTYITYSNSALSLAYNDAMVVVFDGPPTLSSTREIDAFVYSNASPPTPYKGSSGPNFYTPTCPDLKSKLDAQAAASAGRTTYRSQNILILGNFGNKDNARLPDGTGNWDETSLTGSGTSFTRCVTNDPVDMVKTFTAPPAITAPVSSGTVAPGTVVTFTVSALNRTSASMAGVQISDPLPPGLTLTGTPTASAGASASCGGTPTTCVLNAPALLAPGAAATMSFQATVSTAYAGATIQNIATQTGGTALSPPPSADAFVTVSLPVTGAAAFNACHNFAESNCSASGARLYTRLAGAAFSTDIVALRADGAIHTEYVGAGGTAKSVKVDLVDAANGNAQIATQTATFPANDVTGRVVVNWGPLNAAYRNLQVRIIETAGTQPVTSMSTDRFAVRPSALGIATSASAVGPSSSATPVIKAGMPFTVTATANPAAYGETIPVDAVKLATSHARLGNLYAAGGTAALSLQVNAAAANNATYDEVGYFSAQPGAFRDDSFASVDRGLPSGCDPASTCDCISSTSGDSYLSDDLVGGTGRYGCSVGNRTALSFGRFIPHHFAVKPSPAFSAGHPACGFTYMDQPFSLSAEIEARNSLGGKTQNYDGAFANGVVTMQVESGDDGQPIAVARLNRTDAQAWSAGSYLVAANRFARPTAPAEPDGPYDQLAIGVSVADEPALPAAQRPMLINRDMDHATAGCTADTTGSSNGNCSAVNLLAAPARVRFGRLRLSHAHGSELLALPVPMIAEFRTATGGWAINTLDSCTAIGAGSVALQNHIPAGFAASSINVSTGGALSGGSGGIRLAAPNPAPAGRSAVTVCVDLGPDTASVTPGVVAPACSAATSAAMPWLQGRWSETKFDDDPAARATFGVRRSGPIIYRREVY